MPPEICPDRDRHFQTSSAGDWYFQLCYCMFNSTGMANSLLIQMGVLEKPIAFLQSSNHIWLKMWLWSTWKSLGWSAIMYIAAISGIDAELYEAAKVDGATRMQLIWNITIPSLLPTYFVLLMINIANFLSNGMDQYYVFQNAFNMVLSRYLICMYTIWQWEVEVILYLLHSVCLRV